MNGELYPGEFESMEHNGRMDVCMTREEAKMTLDEEIKHAKEVMHSQLAECVKELEQLKVGTKMTKEQKDRILKTLTEDRNYYAIGCNRRVEREWGKIEGADYMLQRFLDVLRTGVDPESEVEE